MGKSSGKTTTTSSSGLPTWQQPYVDKMMKSAESLYGGNGPQYYQGNTVAGFTPTQQAGQAQILQGAGSAADLASSANDAFKWGTTSALDVKNNPYLKDAVSAATQPITQSLLEEALPAIRASAVGNGGFGGSRQGLGEAQAVERANRAATQTASNMYSDAYGKGLSTFANTLSMLPQIQSANLTPGQATSAVGDQQQAQNQAEIDAAKNKWDWEQMLPYQRLTEYANMIKGQYGGTGSSTVSAEGGNSPALQIGGGLISLLPYILGML